MQKQRALVENEQLRMELETLKRFNAEYETMQSTFLEADSEFNLLLKWLIKPYVTEKCMLSVIHKLVVIK